MVEFGDELIIDSFRIPWLIWIQVIVLLLLIILLYSFTLLLSSPSDETETSPASPDQGFLSSSPSPPSSLHGNPPNQKLLQSQLGGEMAGATSTSPGRIRRLNAAGDYHHPQQDGGRGRGRGSVEDNTTTEIKEGGNLISMQSMFSSNHHPCNIVRLAKVAFLKCLGLDGNSERKLQ
ncbi:hypothetical protein SAY86_005320 [Trapa natans]|uniref:Uncharacterized protein n=1 Tax=Trapa natans TaxID=22666 RepID=A0AAN7L8Y8_TRANT|nr:hypothetical protein SAY86_005320 [Trapa natans]